MGILPVGSGNDFIRSFLVDTSFEDCCKVIKSGFTKLVDIGISNTRKWINVAGTGFDAIAAKNVSKFKWIKNGKISYLMAVFYTLISYKAKHMKIVVDDIKDIHQKVYLIAIANGNFYGGGMNVAPKAKIDDGKLDICIVDDISKLKVLRLLPMFMKGKHLDLSFVKYFKCSKLSLDSSLDSGINLD